MGYVNGKDMTTASLAQCLLAQMNKRNRCTLKERTHHNSSVVTKTQMKLVPRRVYVIYICFDNKFGERL